MKTMSGKYFIKVAPAMKCQYTEYTVRCILISVNMIFPEPFVGIRLRPEQVS